MSFEMSPKIIAICIEGTKGAGKSTTIAAIAEHLKTRGWMVKVVAPFALANEHASTLGWQGAVPMFATRLSHRAIVEFEVEVMSSAETAFAEELTSEGANRGVLIFDRGWLTFHAHVFDGAETDPEWRSSLWETALATAPPTLFIHTDPAVTKRRRRGELDAVSGLDGEGFPEKDWRKRLDMAVQYNTKLIGSIETLEDCRVDTVTPALDHIYQRAGFDSASARKRCDAKTIDQPLGQHWLLAPRFADCALSGMELAGRPVVEVGVGTGVLTEAILARGPANLIGVEIDPAIVPLNIRKRIDLRIADVNAIDLTSLGQDGAATLVSTPPYDVLDVLVAAVRAGAFRESLLLVPSHREAEFSDAKSVARLDGDCFEPPARGSHFWLHWSS